MLKFVYFSSIFLTLYADVNEARSNICDSIAEIKSDKLDSLYKCINSLNDKITDLETKLAERHIQDTVYMSTVECSELGDSWTDYLPAAGRFVLGAGRGPLEQEVELNETGGEEAHQLSIEELPSHDHNLAAWRSSIFAPPRGIDPKLPVLDIDGAHGTFSFEAGADEAHNNMPPFIVLRFCIFR